MFISILVEIQVLVVIKVSRNRKTAEHDHLFYVIL